MTPQEVRRIAWETIVEAFALDVSAATTLIPQLKSYTVAGVPSAATYARGLIYVSNEAGGATIAFSDGSNWRRVQDRAVVS